MSGQLDMLKCNTDISKSATETVNWKAITEILVTCIEIMHITDSLALCAKEYCGIIKMGRKFIDLGGVRISHLCTSYFETFVWWNYTLINRHVVAFGTAKTFITLGFQLKVSLFRRHIYCPISYTAFYANVPSQFLILYWIRSQSRS